MSDVLSIRIEMKELESNLELLQDNLVPLSTQFNQLLNLESTEEINLPASVEESDFMLEKMEVLEQITQNNPMIAMYDAEIEAYEHQKKMAKLGGRPMIGAGVNYMPFSPRPEDGMQMGGTDMFMPMVNLSLPIYRKKTNAKIKEAELLQESARLRQEEVTNQLEVDWAMTIRDLQDANRKVRLYEDQSELANQNLNLLLTSYTTQGQGFIEILRAQQQLLDYQLKKLSAVNSQYSAISKLEMLAATDLNIQ